jgi:AcrR family transcriptional regulator
MGRPREHDESTARALLDAAEMLLSEAGYDAISVRAVAEAVGTTTRAVYSLFGSKAGLVEALAGRGYRLLAGYVNDLPVTDDTVADLIAAGMHGFRRFALERPGLFRLTFERAPTDLTAIPSVVEAAMMAYDALATRILRAQDSGALDRRPTEAVAFMLHALCQGLASSELARQPPPTGVGFWQHAADLDTEHLWRTALGALLAGLSHTSSRHA